MTADTEAIANETKVSPRMNPLADGACLSKNDDSNGIGGYSSETGSTWSMSFTDRRPSSTSTCRAALSPEIGKDKTV